MHQKIRRNSNHNKSEFLLSRINVYLMHTKFALNAEPLSWNSICICIIQHNDIFKSSRSCKHTAMYWISEIMKLDRIFTSAFRKETHQQRTVSAYIARCHVWYDERMRSTTKIFRFISYSIRGRRNIDRGV